MNWYKQSQLTEQVNQQVVQTPILDPSVYVRTRENWRVEMQQMIDSFVNRRDEFNNDDIFNHLQAISGMNERYYDMIETWMRQGGVQI